MEKQQLFDQFLTHFQPRYLQVKGLLRLLESKKELCYLFDRFQPLNPDELDDRMKEYLWMVHELTNPVDRDFFNPWWVPVDAKGNNFYTDLSSGKFHLFFTRYFFFEPYCWFRQTLLRDSSVLLRAESPSDLKKALWGYRRDFEVESDRCFLNRHVAGLRGEIKPSPMKKTSMREKSKPVFWTRNEQSLRITGVLPGILALLPRLLPVTIHALKCDYQHPDVLMATPTTVGGFCTLIQNLSASRIHSYTLTFDDGSGHVRYDPANGTGLFELTCTRDDVTNHVLKQLLKRFAP